MYGTAKEPYILTFFNIYKTLTITMRLTREKKEILSFLLHLNYDEMAEGRNKELAAEMLGYWQSQQIWGNAEGICESFFPDNDEY